MNEVTQLYAGKIRLYKIHYKDGNTNIEHANQKNIFFLISVHQLFYWWSDPTQDYTQFN